MELKIEYLPVSKLAPYKSNARKHGKEDVDAIAASIKEFGFSDPIGIWGDSVIVEGHGRLLAAKKLGMESVPVIRLDHMSDEQRRAYALAHNKTAELSEWDANLLGAELTDISDIDMAEFGFDLTELEDFAEQEAEPEMEEAELTDYRHVHWLITVDEDDAPRFRAAIEKLEQMGATVKETKNST